MNKENSYDYLVLGGGTAGAVIAARLAENTAASVCLVEAGPSDEGQTRVLELRRWMDLLGSDLDYDYEISAQERGNGLIRHSRGRVLGGCSSHNSAISFRTPDVDLEEWESLGATGWGPEESPATTSTASRSACTGKRSSRRTPAASRSSRPPNRPGSRWSASTKRRFGKASAGLRSTSATESVSRARSLICTRSTSCPSNLTILTDTQIRKVLLDADGDAIGAETNRGAIYAGREVIVCCGAFDTPKLLLLSGIGPEEHLREVGVEPLVDLPGVGENLLDHPEGIVMWESSRPVPDGLDPVLGSRAVCLHGPGPGPPGPDVSLRDRTLRRKHGPARLPHHGPGLLHHAERGPRKKPGHRAAALIRRPSATPPLIDFRYFTDPEGHDERVMLEGVKLARRIAEQPALRSWVGRELAPGPENAKRRRTLRVRPPDGEHRLPSRRDVPDGGGGRAARRG